MQDCEFGPRFAGQFERLQRLSTRRIRHERRKERQFFSIIPVLVILCQPDRAKHLCDDAAMYG